jgi:hypothetical protein
MGPSVSDMLQEALNKLNEFMFSGLGEPGSEFLAFFYRVNGRFLIPKTGLSVD